jgi:hypothetical protein
VTATIISLFSLLCTQTPLPFDGAEALQLAKKRTAYVLPAEGATFQVTGPAKVVVQLLGVAGTAGKHAEVRLVRDQAFQAKSSVVFAPHAGAKGRPTMAMLALEVPDGEHTYRIIADSPMVAVEARLVAKLPPKLRPADETKLAEAPAATPPAAAEVAVATAAPEALAPAATPPAPAAPSVATVQPPEPPKTNATPVAAAAPTEAEQAVAAHDRFAMSVGGGQEEGMERPAHALSMPESTHHGMRVAVYDLQLEGIDKSIGTAVTNSLLAEVRKLQGISAIGMSEIRDMLALEAMKDAVGCNDVTCLAEIGGALGVDELVTGTLSKVGDGNVAVIRRVDQTHAKVAGAYNQRLKPGQGEEFLLAIGPAVQELYPSHALRPGAKRGVAEELVMRLHPPPLPRWLFWTTSGTAAGLGALGGGAMLIAQNKVKAHNAYAARGVPPNDPIDGAVLADKRAEANTWRNAALGLLIGAGVVALASGTEALFTDWYVPPSSAAQ